MRMQTIKRLVRLLLPFDRPLRSRFSIRTHATIRPPPQRQRFPRFSAGTADGREEEIASRHLRLMRSYFAMSSISPKFILLIIKDIHFSNLPDPAYSATKRP